MNLEVVPLMLICKIRDTITYIHSVIVLLFRDYFVKIETSNTYDPKGPTRGPVYCDRIIGFTFYFCVLFFCAQVSGLGAQKHREFPARIDAKCSCNSGQKF